MVFVDAVCSHEGSAFSVGHSCDTVTCFDDSCVAKLHPNMGQTACHGSAHASSFISFRPTEKSGCVSDCRHAYKLESKPCQSLKQPGQKAQYGSCMQQARHVKHECKNACKQHGSTSHASRFL